MNSKRSKALKARWAKIPKEKRSLEMARVATIKNKKMTKKQRVAHANMMVKARTKTK